MRHLTKKLRQRTQGRKSEKGVATTLAESLDRRTSTSAGKGGGKGKRGKKFVHLHGENITINHDVESGSTLNPRHTALIEEKSPKRQMVSFFFLV